MTFSTLTKTTVIDRIKSRVSRFFGPWGIFFKGFIKHPVMVGSIIPSSRFTIDKMLAPVDWQQCKLFVEYGPGVGTFCYPVLERLRRDGTRFVSRVANDLYTPIYVLMGWGAMAYIVDFFNANATMMTLILIGGLCYTIGAVVYGFKKPNPFPGQFGFHEIFHSLTVIAFLCHWTAALLIALNPAPGSFGA